MKQHHSKAGLQLHKPMVHGTVCEEVLNKTNPNTSNHTAATKNKNTSRLRCYSIPEHICRNTSAMPTAPCGTTICSTFATAAETTTKTMPSTCSTPKAYLTGQCSNHQQARLNQEITPGNVTHHATYLHPTKQPSSPPLPNPLRTWCCPTTLGLASAIPTAVNNIVKPIIASAASTPSARAAATTCAATTSCDVTKGRVSKTKT